MAKKAAAHPRRSSKKTGAHKRPAHAGRAYSLEDILSEYRSAQQGDESAPAPPPDKPEGSARQRSQEAKAFAETMRTELHQGEKTLPEADNTPERSEEELSRRKKPPEKEAPAESPVPEEDADSPETPGEAPAAKPKRDYRPGGEKQGPFRRLYGWILGLAALSAIKKRMKSMAEEDRGPEVPELSALDSAKVYAAQLPAFFQRSRSALLLSLLALWIALSRGANIPIPGSLGTDIRTATLVSLTLLLTVMLLGLDVLTAGILSAAGGKPGWETLLSFACLCSAADCVSVVLSKNSAAPLPPCAVCCVGIALALRGSQYRCRSLKNAFLILHRSGGASTVNGVRLSTRKGQYMLRQYRSTAGFIHAAEEMDICEKTGRQLSPFLLLAIPVLGALAAFLGQGFSAFPHILAVLSAVCCCWTGMVSLPMLMSSLSTRLSAKGAAVSGWEGIRELGDCSHLIVTDQDLFPEGTIAFNSIRILSGQETEQVISRTLSLIYAAGSDLSALFADLVERSGGRMVPVPGVTVEDGGIMGFVEGQEVLVGNAGYMYLQGVKIDPTLVGEGKQSIVYTAYDRELVGAFGIVYTPSPRISAALHSLQRRGHKPVFALQDFNIDTKLLEDLFRCKADSFEFPTVAEQAQLENTRSEERSFPAAILSGGGLDVLTDVFDSGRYVARCGSILRLLCIVSTVLGLLLGFIFCLRGSWGVVSVTRMLLYLFFWLFPSLAMNASSRL